MKKRISGFFADMTNNIWLKLLALLLAVMIWLVVVSIDNPVKDQNFTQIPVTVLNGEVFESAGEAYELAETSKYVTVTVRAERMVLSQLSRDDFTATIDMNNYSNGRVPINVKANRLADRIVSITPRTAYAAVHVEELGTKQYSIDYEITGTPADGYSVGSVTLANNVVRVQGPESLVDTIDRAIVRVSAQGMTRDMRTEAPIIFIDRNGEEVDTTNLELSRSTISVSVEIWEDKEVSVTYSYTGTPAEGFAATGKINSTINNIKVGGDPEVLSSLASISIPSSEIDITGATENVMKTIDISAYLPAGVNIADKQDETMASVTVEIVAMSLLNVEVPASNITIVNEPEGFVVQVGGGATSVVTSVRGLPEILASVNGTMLTGHIDMEDVKIKNNIDEWTTGLYDAEVTFAYPEGVYSSGVTTMVKVFVQPETAPDISEPVDNNN
jgi:YbbR domain-containing protein